MSKAVSDVAKRIEAIQEKHDLPPKQAREVVNSGCLGIDLAIRVPGLPRGVMIDLYGSEGLGKTTLALTMAKERIVNNERVIYIDVEHRINPDLVDIIIGDSELFTITHPTDGDAALTELAEFAEIPEVRMIIVDSVSALLPKQALDNPDKSYIAAVAIAMNNLLKRLAIIVYNNDTIVVFINQVRSAPMGFGPVNNQMPTGGRALKFYASLRMHMTPSAPIKIGDQIVGQKVDITMVKNSYRAPFGRTSINIIYGQGVDKMRDVVDRGIETDIIGKSSSWYTYKDIKENGENNLTKALIPHYDEICAEIRVKFKELEDKRKELARQAMGMIDSVNQEG